MVWILVLAACSQESLSPGARDRPPDPDVTTTQRPPADLACQGIEPVVLNEVSPANVATLVDVTGRSVDWLELTNAGDQPVDLAGWTLSDDADEPAKWTFPSLTLDPDALLLVYASGEDRARVVGSWDTRIDEGHSWRYLPVVQASDPDWFLPDYDDSDWGIGPSGFGKGDDDDATRVEASTVYIRTHLELTADELADLTALVLHVDFDDGFAAYLNGVDVASVALGLPGQRAWDDPSAYKNEAQLHKGGKPTYFDLDAAMGLLHEGTNTLALEVHNLTVDSSDLSLIPFLTLGFASDRGAGAAPVLELPEIDLHTNFEIRASGEAVRLYDPAGCPADELDPVPLWADESFGRQPDGTGTLGYFLEPTPGGPNVTESRPGFAAPPVLDPPGGVHVGGTTVDVTAAPGTQAHIAWNGWEPTEADARVEGPVQTPTSGAAAVLRARAFQDGLWPSRIATATYLLEPAGDLPIVSLVTDPSNLWDEETGILAYGPNAGTEYPWRGANFYEYWQRPAHVELWEPDRTSGFAIDGSIEVHGGNSRRQEQKNLEIKIDGGFSDDDAIEYPVWPELGISTVSRVLLRAGGADWLGCGGEGCNEDAAMLRDTLMQRIAAGTDLDRMASRPVRAYLNGEYHGLYFLNEKADDDWVQMHHGHEDIDLLKNGGIPVTGDPFSWLEVLEWLRTHDLADPANEAHVETLIDVDELQTYLILQVFYANTDWPETNMKLWRPRTPDGRWRWILYGTEFGLGLKQPSDHDTLAFALAPDGEDWPNPAWATELFRLMFESPRFTESFVNRYADLLNTQLAPERTRGLLNDLADEIAPEIPRQVDRWGTFGVETLDGTTWDPEIASIDAWLLERPGHARQHVLDAFGLAGTWTLTLEADPPGSGTFELTAVTVDAPFTGIYFQGVPVTVTAHPEPGFTFAGWSDPSLGAAPTVVVDSAEALTLVGRFD